METPLTRSAAEAMGSQKKVSGCLFIVGTPIGNLGDLSFRAREVLAAADVVAAEDTRHAGLLLKKYEIKARQVSYHQHSDPQKILALLAEGKKIALISDAGTPGISDPGTRLVAEAIAAGYAVSPVPGPSALITALCASGLPTDRFSFFGFAPHKKGRETFFRSLSELDHTAIFYESTHRIQKCVEQLQQWIPDRRIVLARELTKIHEEFLRGHPAEILAVFQKTPEKMKGEFVVLVAGAGF